MWYIKFEEQPREDGILSMKNIGPELMPFEFRSILHAIICFCTERPL